MMAVVAAPAAGNDLFGGTNLLRLLFLAFGGALVVGNVLALIRPPSHLPTEEKGATPQKPPMARSVTMIAVGMVAVVWALASLTAG